MARILIVGANGEAVFLVEEALVDFGEVQMAWDYQRAMDYFCAQRDELAAVVVLDDLGEDDGMTALNLVDEMSQIGLDGPIVLLTEVPTIANQVEEGVGIELCAAGVTERLLELVAEAIEAQEAAVTQEAAAT